ncbi:DUF6184 family natural product biosynthesis lipoprotein [Polyangium aurulentum]|uniref:DUF6184 family natural product biosynthesis lipoprotein n=1 Tax=Polyangium aurulentum TaxID=2567896 RepID=UPI0010AEC397|nr:DUF6184 family natural product biosynthesis lipoprotein [Polyangium aurulentum]UQA61651.1 hypothetical protein E8A73_014730 [Polyangium aurulentum]
MALGAEFVFTACDRDNEAIGAIPPREVNRALLSVAAARCDRAERCMQVGPHHRYDTRSDCVTAVRAKENDELNLNACPGGIDREELDECLEEIREAECDSTLDALSATVACRASDLCLGR